MLLKGCQLEVFIVCFRLLDHTFWPCLYNIAYFAYLMGNLVGCKPPPAAAAMFLEVKFGGRRVEACGLYTFFTLIELVLLVEAILVRELIVPPSLLLVAEEGLEPEPVFLPPLRWHDLVPQSLTLRLPSSVAATEAVFSTSAVAVMKKEKIVQGDQTQNSGFQMAVLLKLSGSIPTSE